MTQSSALASLFPTLSDERVNGGREKWKRARKVPVFKTGGGNQ